MEVCVSEFMTQVFKLSLYLKFKMILQKVGHGRHQLPDRSLISPQEGLLPDDADSADAGVPSSLGPPAGPLGCPAPPSTVGALGRASSVWAGRMGAVGISERGRPSGETPSLLVTRTLQQDQSVCF